MKFLTQSYNNGGSAYNAEAEETSILSYRIEHRFNEPAEAWITLADPTGTIAAKYNDDANDVYIGAGKCTIEDPNNTDVFFGRIIEAKAGPDRTVEIYAQDWLSQLNDEQITYDMREKLESTNNSRQSTLTPDYADTDGNGIAVAGYEAITYAKQDDGGAFTDQPTAAQDETADDVDVLPNVPAVNDAYYYGFDVKVNGLVINLTTQGDWGGSVAWEYWDGAQWSDCGESDGTVNYEAGTGWYEVTFTAPGDWAQNAVDGDTAYWVRSRVDAYISMTTVPKVGQVFGRLFYVYDQSAILTADAHNGQYLILTDYMAGSKEWSTGPYDEVVTGDGGGIDSDLGDEGEVWVDDSNSHNVWDNDENWTQDYYFRINLGHNTSSDLYVDDSVTAIKFTAKLWFADDTNQDAVCYAQVYDNNGSAWRNMGGVSCEAHGKGQASGEKWYNFHVPDAYLNYVTNSDGVAKLRFNVTQDNATYLYVFYVKIHITCETTGYSSAITINDGLTYRLTLDTDLWDLYDHTVQIWDGVKYCVAKEIYKHIDSDESGTLITGGDDMETLTCAATIEHTSGISTRQYEDATRLEILQDLAVQDKAEMYIALGATTVNWKSTWGANSNTITDGDVDSWTMSQDWSKVANEFNVYGMRIGDQQLYSNKTDATSIAKYKATRSRTVRDAGLVSEYDTAAKGTALVNQYKDVQKMLSATIYGFDTSYRLGTITEVTSADMGITAVDYIVNYWSYDSETHTSRIRLHPKVSTTGLIKDIMDRSNQGALDSFRRGARKEYVPEPSSHEVS